MREKQSVEMYLFEKDICTGCVLRENSPSKRFFGRNFGIFFFWGGGGCLQKYNSSLYNYMTYIYIITEIIVTATSYSLERGSRFNQKKKTVIFFKKGIFSSLSPISLSFLLLLFFLILPPSLFLLILFLLPQDKYCLFTTLFQSTAK